MYMNPLSERPVRLAEQGLEAAGGKGADLEAHRASPATLPM